MCFRILNPHTLIRVLLFLATVAHVAPDDGMVCFNCQKLDCLRKDKKDSSGVCSDQHDACVTIFRHHKIDSRGCFSEIPENIRKQCDTGDEINCMQCFSKFCNNHMKYVAAKGSDSRSSNAAANVLDGGSATERMVFIARLAFCVLLHNMLWR